MPKGVACAQKRQTGASRGRGPGSPGGALAAAPPATSGCPVKRPRPHLESKQPRALHSLKVLACPQGSALVGTWRLAKFPAGCKARARLDCLGPARQGRQMLASLLPGTTIFMTHNIRH